MGGETSKEEEEQAHVPPARAPPAQAALAVERAAPTPDPSPPKPSVVPPPENAAAKAEKPAATSASETPATPTVPTAAPLDEGKSTAAAAQEKSAKTASVEEKPAVAAPSEVKPAPVTAVEENKPAPAVAAGASAAEEQKPVDDHAKKTSPPAPASTEPSVPAAKDQPVAVAEAKKPSVEPTTAEVTAADKPVKGAGKAKGQGGKSSQPSTKISVKNLAEDTTVESLKLLCQTHGTVAHVDVKMKEDGKCRGIAFVTLASAEEAAKAVAAMQGSTVGEKTLQVAVVERREARTDQADSTDKGKGKGKGKEKGKGFEKGAEKGVKGKGKGKDWGAHAGAAMGDAAAFNAQQYMQDVANLMQMYYYNPEYWGGYHMGHMGMCGGDPYQYQQYMAMMQQQAAASYAHAASWNMSAMGAAGAAMGAKEYIGTLKSISDRNRYGFIECEEAKASYDGRDVYVDRDLLPRDVKVNDRLKFTITVNEKGHPKVSSHCTVLPALPTSPSGGAGGAQRAVLGTDYHHNRGVSVPT